MKSAKSNNSTIKVLLDNGIFSHAEFAKSVSRPVSFKWGPNSHQYDEPGFIRKPADSNKSRQDELDALFTIGRLIREKRIEAFSYIELKFESWRGTGRATKFNALVDCDVKTCSSPIVRGKFRRTGNLIAYSHGC